MTHNGGVCDLGSGQMPLDLRIASFIAGIQMDPVGSGGLSNTEQGSTASEQNEHPVQQSAMRMEQSTLALAAPQRPAGARNGRQTSNRKRRYRDDRQKLSNSLAQKRYRERKKKAFDSMKTLVDSLTIEVERLQHIKRENEKLTLEMEEYRQLAETHGMTIANRPAAQVPASAMEMPPMSAMAVACPSTAQLQSRSIAGQLCSLQNLPAADWIAALSQICQCRSSIQMDGSISMQARVQQLEQEWNERMMAVEHILRLRNSCGSPAGATTEHMLPVLRTCMASMFSLNSDIAAMKLQQLSQDTQSNNERIQKAFLFLSNDK